VVNNADTTITISMPPKIDKENYIIFYSEISYSVIISIDSTGNWLPAKNMKSINSGQLNYCTSVLSDGKSVFFTSERHQLPSSFSGLKGTYRTVLDTYASVLNGNGNIYRIHFSSIKKLSDK
jgi:hypothetical protein